MDFDPDVCKTIADYSADEAHARYTLEIESVPKREFLNTCTNCGEGFKACPTNVSQAKGFQQELHGLWMPLVNAKSSCNVWANFDPLARF